MENLKVFKKNFKEGMLMNDFEAFKRAYPILLKCILKSMEEYASQFQKQLKEKEEEIEDLKRSKGLWEFAYNTEKQNYSRLSILLEDKGTELTKSNEMADRLAESLRKLSSQEHIEQDLYIRFIKDAFDILEQYQNSKK